MAHVGLVKRDKVLYLCNKKCAYHVKKWYLQTSLAVWNFSKTSHLISVKIPGQLSRMYTSLKPKTFSFKAKNGL